MSYPSHATLPVLVPSGHLHLAGDLRLPDRPRGLIVFAHGSGSSRHSPRNQFVAGALVNRGFGTLLMDLLTREEDLIDQATAVLRFDVAMLGKRVVNVLDWLPTVPELAALPVGLFGASTGAAAALIAAATRPHRVSAVVSRGGRPDLANASLPHVQSPTLLLVGALDDAVIPLNQQAQSRMHAAMATLEIVPGATHLFEEPGTLEVVARRAGDWFADHLVPAGTVVR
jgi:dienelactone hydrolase